MPGEQLQSTMDILPRLLDESQATHRGPEDGDEVVIVRFHIALFRPAIMTGCEGMNDARVMPGVPKRTPDDLVIGTGHLDPDNDVFDGVFFDRVSARQDGEPNVTATMLHSGRRDQYPTMEVREHPLRTILRTVNTDNPERLRPRHLHALLNHPRWLAQDGLRKRF